MSLIKKDDFLINKNNREYENPRSTSLTRVNSKSSLYGTYKSKLTRRSANSSPANERQSRFCISPTNTIDLRKKLSQNKSTEVVNLNKQLDNKIEEMEELRRLKKSSDLIKINKLEDMFINPVFNSTLIENDLKKQNKLHRKAKNYAAERSNTDEIQPEPRNKSNSLITSISKKLPKSASSNSLLEEKKIIS